VTRASAHALLATPALSDAATIERFVGLDVASMPLSNLQTTQLYQKCRTRDAGGDTLRLRISGITGPINLVALIGTNADAATQWRVQGSTNAYPWTQPLYDSGTMSHWPDVSPAVEWSETLAIHWMSTPQTYPYWAIEVYFIDQPYYDVGRLYIANAYQPTIDVQPNWDLGIVDGSPKTVTPGMRTFVDRRPVARRLSFGLKFDSEDEAFDQAFEIDRRRGISRDVLFCLDPHTANPHRHKQTIYGLMRELPPLSSPVVEFYEKSYVIEELL